MTTTVVNADNLKDAISSSGNFAALGGIRWWVEQPNYAWIRVGLYAGAGVIGVSSGTTSGSTTPAATSTSTTPNDHFPSTFDAGVIFKQASGGFAGSYCQFEYLRDPQFPNHPNRFAAKVRLVYTPQTLVSLPNVSSPTLSTTEGNALSKDALSSGLGGFLEGLVNLGSGAEEVRITLGIKLSLDAIFKSLFGTGTTTSQAAAKH